MSENLATINLLQNQLALARREINNLRQQVVSLSHLHKKEIGNIYSKLETWQCKDCKKKQERGSDPETTTARPKTSNEFGFKAIGIINTHFPEKRGIPRQPGILKDTIAKLTLSKDVFTNPAHALEGLQEFSHMWILFYFHKNDSTHVKAKVAPPRLNGIRTGVFATRSPHRPCAIGLSLVKIDRIMDNVIYFCGVDMVDKTPVFDVKPYIPQYDNPSIMNHFNITLDDTDNIAQTVGGSRSNVATAESLPLNNNQENGPVPFGREMDGQENERESQVLEVPGVSNVRVETSFHRRSSSRMGEREAPDGEEEEPSASSQGNSFQTPSTSSGNNHVRVPSWIDQAPVSRLNVTFKDRALAQLLELGLEAEEKKTIITNVLREDPRSVYLRERWGGHCYVFRIAELFVSCKFSDETHSVTVYQIFQNERQAEGDD